MSECICDGSGFFMTPDADGESAYEVACPDPAHNQDRCPETGDGMHMAFGSATTCQFCGAPDPGPSEQARNRFADLSEMAGDENWLGI